MCVHVASCVPRGSSPPAGDLPGCKLVYGTDGYHRLSHGAPVFAVEVRDWIDDGDESERRMAAKRADYFAAGTQVVWDVDALAEELIRAYRANDPDHPVVYHRGDIADAELAVPGWRFQVDELFD